MGINPLVLKNCPALMPKGPMASRMVFKDAPREVTGESTKELII